MGEVAVLHPEVVGGCLKLAAAALLAGGAVVVAFDEKELGDRPPQLVQFRGVALHFLALHRGLGAGGERLAADDDGAEPA